MKKSSKKQVITSEMVSMQLLMFLRSVSWCSVISTNMTGLRYVKPYYFTFTTHAKGRWVGSPVYDVFCREFQAESPEYYVCEQARSILLYILTYTQIHVHTYTLYTGTGHQSKQSNRYECECTKDNRTPRILVLCISEIRENRSKIVGPNLYPSE